MSETELRHEIEESVVFWGFEQDGRLVAVMGIQQVKDVTLIRHAYVRTGRQRRGIGKMLLSQLRSQTTGPILIGTWADAIWAIQFYEGQGFRLVPPGQKGWLLRKYWSVPERQIENSVVLADQTWFDEQGESVIP